MIETDHAGVSAVGHPFHVKNLANKRYLCYNSTGNRVKEKTESYIGKETLKTGNNRAKSCIKIFERDRKSKAG